MEILEFSWLPALAGGIMIGTASALLMAFNGRVAGISGILGGLLSRWSPGSMVEADFSPRIGSRRRRSLLLGT